MKRRGLLLPLVPLTFTFFVPIAPLKKFERLHCSYLHPQRAPFTLLSLLLTYSSIVTYSLIMNEVRLHHTIHNKAIYFQVEVVFIDGL